MSFKRPPMVYTFLLLATIGMGLLSRADFIPKLIYPYLGDMFYSLMVFYIFGLLFPKMPSLTLAGMTIALCFLIELSQLYQADWINAIRATRLGGLLLGYGFLWSDLASYIIGGFLGFAVEQLLLKKASKF